MGEVEAGHVGPEDEAMDYMAFGGEKNTYTNGSILLSYNIGTGHNRVFDLIVKLENLVVCSLFATPFILTLKYNKYSSSI